MRRGSFVSVHGIDGTGKTTVVDGLLQEMTACNLSVCSAESITTATTCSSRPYTNETSPQERVLAKLISKATQGVRIGMILETGMHVVKDRWAIDVIADESHKGAIVGKHLLDTVLQPDLAVLLTCDEDVRMQRIQNRDCPTPDDLVPNAPGTRAHYFQSFLVENLPYTAPRSLTLDTTHETAEQIVNTVIENLYV